MARSSSHGQLPFWSPCLQPTQLQPPPHLGPGWQGPPNMAPPGPAGPTVISAAPQLTAVPHTYEGTDEAPVTELPSAYADKLQAKEEATLKQIEEIKRKNMMENVKKKSAEIKAQLQNRITKTPIAARLGAAKSQSPGTGTDRFGHPNGMVGRLGIASKQVIKIPKVEPKKSVKPARSEKPKATPTRKSSRFDVPPPEVNMKVTVQFPPTQPPSKLKQMCDAADTNTSAQLKQLLTPKPITTAPPDININEEEELDYNEDIDDLVDHSFGDALEFDL